VTSNSRTVAVSVLLVLAGFFVLLSSFAVWVDRVALNTNVFVDTSAELIEDDAIRQAVATRAVDELYASVDVEAEIKDPLPEDLESASGPVAAGLRQVAPLIVERALQQPSLQRLWAAALEQSHKTLVAVLEGDRATVSTQGGVVTLDLEQIILDAADRLGIRKQVADNLPEDVGRIEILRSDELDTAQDAFQFLKTLAWLLPIVTLVLLALAVGISRRRRATMRGVGIAIVVAGAVGLVAANLTGNYLVDSLVNDRDTREAAGNAWDILTVLLRSSLWWLIAVGALIVVATWVAGPGRTAIAVRRVLAPLVRERRYAYAGLAVVAVVLLATGPVDNAIGLFVLLILLGLLAAWIELTRAQTIREFPGAELAAPTFFGDTRGRVAEWLESRRVAAASTSRRAPEPSQPSQPSQVPQPPQPPQANDVTTRLEHLADLHARGELTDLEYASAKARVLAGE
jgi:hypothetical protein